MSKKTSKAAEHLKTIQARAAFGCGRQRLRVLDERHKHESTHSATKADFMASFRLCRHQMGAGKHKLTTPKTGRSWRPPRIRSLCATSPAGEAPPAQHPAAAHPGPHRLAVGLAWFLQLFCASLAPTTSWASWQDSLPALLARLPTEAEQLLASLSSPHALCPRSGMLRGSRGPTARFSAPLLGCTGPAASSGR